MPESPTNPDLMPSLGRLARGLSALFWGLPAAMLTCVQTSRSEWLQSFGVLPPLAATGLVLYGLWMMTPFQPQERIWQRTLDRAKLMGLLTMGLSPYLFWVGRNPFELAFVLSGILFLLCSLLLLGQINAVLVRLSAMLPDETLRHETRQFGGTNRGLLFLVLLLVMAYCGLMLLSNSRWMTLFPEAMWEWVARLDRHVVSLLIMALLLPLAMTMALIWKTKEVILESVFGHK